MREKSSLSVLYGCLDKALEKGVRLIGTGLEFGMILNAYIEGTVGDFNRFNKTAVG